MIEECYKAEIIDRINFHMLRAPSNVDRWNKKEICTYLFLQDDIANRVMFRSDLMPLVEDYIKANT